MIPILGHFYNNIWQNLREMFDFYRKILFILQLYATFVFTHGCILSGCILAFPACLIPQLKAEGNDISTMTQSILGEIRWKLQEESILFSKSCWGTSFVSVLCKNCWLSLIFSQIFFLTLAILYFHPLGGNRWFKWFSGFWFCIKLKVGNI